MRRPATASPGTAEMKKAIPILLLTLAVALPLSASASKRAPRESPPTTFTVLLAGGAESNEMRIWLTPDGRNYVIDSVVPLEVGGSVCQNAPGNPNELICGAVQVAAFEFNADAGDDVVRVASEVHIPVTMRGGPGRDTLVGGSGDDKLGGGPGPDKVIGRDGDDQLLGGDGYDSIFGGAGDDFVKGGPGPDNVFGGSGDNQVQQD